MKDVTTAFFFHMYSYVCTSHKTLTHVRLCSCTESDGFALFITGHVEVGQVDVTWEGGGRGGNGRREQERKRERGENE